MEIVPKVFSRDTRIGLKPSQARLDPTLMLRQVRVREDTLVHSPSWFQAPLQVAPCTMGSAQRGRTVRATRLNTSRSTTVEATIGRCL